MFLLNYFRKHITKHDTSVTFTTVDAHVPPDPAFVRPLENGGGGNSIQPNHPSLQGPVCTCGADPSLAPPGTNISIDQRSGGSGSSGSCKKVGKNISFATSVDVVEPQPPPELLTCISEEGLLNNYYDYVGECVSSCHKLDNFFNFRDFDNVEIVDEGDLHNERLARANSSSGGYSIRRAPVISPTGRRLRQTSAVSFSEPEGLARLGQNHHQSSYHHHHHYPEVQTMCTGRPPPVITQHHHHHHPSSSNRYPMEHPAPKPHHTPPPCTSSTRRSPGHRPRRSVTVVEEMTTSV